jgi:hypothetical protein
VGAAGQERGTHAVLWIGANASGHASPIGRSWVRPHTRVVQQTGHGRRLLVCYLPPKRPWLTPLAPQGLPGQRTVLAHTLRQA